MAHLGLLCPLRLPQLEQPADPLHAGGDAAAAGGGQLFHAPEKRHATIWQGHEATETIAHQASGADASQRAPPAAPPQGCAAGPCGGCGRRSTARAWQRQRARGVVVLAQRAVQRHQAITQQPVGQQAGVSRRSSRPRCSRPRRPAGHGHAGRRGCAGSGRAPPSRSPAHGRSAGRYSPGAAAPAGRTARWKGAAPSSWSTQWPARSSVRHGAACRERRCFSGASASAAPAAACATALRMTRPPMLCASTVISCSGTGQWRARCSSCRASARPLSEVRWPVL